MENKEKEMRAKEWRKAISFQQAMEHLYRQAIAEWLSREDEVTDEFSGEVEFLLGLKGRWLLCHIKKTSPYTIRFRLIGERDYIRVTPWDFIERAKQMLLH